MRKPLLHILLSVILTLNLCAQESKDDIGLVKKQAEVMLNTLQKHYHNGEYNQHKKYSDSLLRLSKKHGLTNMQVKALINQAVFYNNRNEQQKSIALYHSALELCKSIPGKTRTKAMVLVNMANTYRNMGFYEKSTETYNKVLEYIDGTENTGLINAAALQGLSNNYAEQGNHEKALGYAIKTKVLGEQLENENIIATALIGISDSHYHLKNYNEAIKAGEIAMELPYVSKPNQKRAWVLLNLGLSHIELGNLEMAENYLTEAKEIASAKELMEVRMHCHEHLSNIYELKGDLTKSHTELKEYAKIRDVYLKNQREASEIDLTHDLNSKEDEIISKQTSIRFMEQRQGRMLIYIIILGIILSGLLFYYKQQKKKAEKKQRKLSEAYALLKNSFVNLKTAPKNILETSILDLKDETKKQSPYKNSALTQENREHYKKIILDFMTTERPYLDYNTNQSELASKMDISTHHFSEVLHFCFEQNFYNFINSYRINEAKKLMASPKYKDTKILAIIFDSGFKSKTSFNRIFKKHTGVTPSQFRKNMI